MGQITLVSSGIPNLLPMRDRSPGIHLSDVIHDRALRLGHYGSGAHSQSELNMTRMQLGCALEDTIARRFAQDNPDRYIQPGEVYLQDLPVTPDYLDTLTHTVNEIKLTWMSSNQPPDGVKFLKYWWQIKAQCKALKSSTGRLHVCHMRGDYKGFDIHYNVWQQEFTQKDLEENESMLLHHRDLMLKEGWARVNQEE